VSRVTGKPSRRIDALRDRGFRGGRIAPHRAMIGLEVTWTLAIDLIVLPLMFTVAMFALLDPLMAAWRSFFALVAGPLGLPTAMGTRLFEIGPLAVPIPYFTAPGFWPEARDLQTGWLFTGVLAGVGMLLRGRLLPVGYFLRAVAVIQLSAQLWFWLAPPPLIYTLPDYVSGLLVCGVIMLLLAPFLVAFTFHIFDFVLWQKLMMATLLLGHLAVLLPLQAAVHVWIIHHGSFLTLPVLFFLFGPLLDVFVYVALYGWGMSWRSGGVLDAVDRRPPTPVQKYPADRPRPTPTPRSTAAVPGPPSFSSLRAWPPGLVWRRLFPDRTGGG
jgi:hypothetical protein